jgi:hypothetical protein
MSGFFTNFIEPFVWLVFFWFFYWMGKASNRRIKRYWRIKSNAMNRFDTKLKEFGWDKMGVPADVNNGINLKRDITKNALEFENNQMISFIDRYCIEDSYAIFQFCTIQGRLLNKKLRFLLEGRGLYNFEIDLYIIKGSCATRLAMLDRIDL